MSLSAPELGFEPPFLGSLRYAVSSSELLHERAMQRFYEATQNEEKEKIASGSPNQLVPTNVDYETESNASRRSSINFGNTPEIPTIRIDPDSDSELLERKHSLRRRLSGSGISQQMLWQHRLSWNKEQQQLKAAEELNNVKEEVTTEPAKGAMTATGSSDLRDKLKLGKL